MTVLKFKALHTNSNGNLVLEPIEHKEPVEKRTMLLFKGKKAAEIFDTIASVESPVYLAKPFSEIENGSILQTGGKTK